MIRWLCLSLLWLSACVAVCAQNPPATITGVVLDQNAEVIDKAQVTLKGGAPARSRTTTTDVAGAFRFEKLNAGDYELLVTREGFKQTTIQLTVGNRPHAPLRIILPVAELHQEVAVPVANAQ